MRFETPKGIDAESRRVLEYVNREVARHHNGKRTEPLGSIPEAARERLDRYSRRVETTRR